MRSGPVASGSGGPGRTILGLDPGSLRTGYGVIRPTPDGTLRLASGAIRLDGDLPFADRLPELRRGVLKLLQTYEPQEAALETCFVARSARAALVLGHIRGALILLCLESGVKVFEYAPTAVKRAVTGHGGASKQQVGAMLRRLLIDPPERPSTDESDALAIAYCHANRPLGRSARTHWG